MRKERLVLKILTYSIPNREARVLGPPPSRFVRKEVENPFIEGQIV